MPESTESWVRRTLQKSVAPEEPATSGAVGELELAPFQARAVRRGVAIVRRYGGVIVADAVGLGKTRVSVGIADVLRRDLVVTEEGTGCCLVCVPARLREQWRRKLSAAEFDRFELLSHTAMSRGGVEELTQPPDLVVVDEAHRFRNPDANRSEALAAVCSESPVVMATATPVCNSLWDLYHLLSLFLAEHDLRRVVGFDLKDAFSRAEGGEFDLTELVEEVVIRRVTPPDQGAFGERPATRLQVLEYEARPDEAWIWERLEPQLRALQFAAFGEEWPRELFIEYALRRWESGPEALRETLERIREFHRRWLEARRHGRRLDREEFRELFRGAADFRQEVFPFLFGEEDEARSREVEAVESDYDKIGALCERVNRVVDRQKGPLDPIARLADGLGKRLLIFTRYRKAARGLFRALRERLGSRGRLAIATGATARASGLGKTSIDEILRRFAPRSYGGESLAAHQQIRVLVCTDCLSEGVNLQDCGHVVLADLPYSALVVEQRIGRLVRPGSPHDTVHVYLPRPQNWSDTLGLRRRLRRKMAQARKSGVGFAATGVEMLDQGASSPRRREKAGGAAHRRGTPVRPGAEETQDRVRRANPDGERPLGAAQMGMPSEPASPLAAMTKLDALYRELGPADRDPEGGFWESSAPVREPCLWLAVEQVRETERTFRWLLVRDGEPIEHRRSHLVRGLVALADAGLELESCEPPQELLEPAEAWVEERVAHLRAALLAPMPVPWDAPQFRLWRRICRWFDEGALEVSEGELEMLRRRLLRPVPRGLRRRIETLVGAEKPPERVHRDVDRMLDSAPPLQPHIDMAIRSGVHLLPRPP